MFKQFKHFLAQKNAIEMAVGIIIGSAMTNFVHSLTNNLINPIIGLCLGHMNLSNFTITVGQTSFGIGSLINSFISLILIIVIVFLLAKGLIAITNYQENRTQTSTELLTQIRDLLQAQNNSNPALKKNAHHKKASHKHK